MADLQHSVPKNWVHSSSATSPRGTRRFCSVGLEGQAQERQDGRGRKC